MKRKWEFIGLVVAVLTVTMLWLAGRLAEGPAIDGKELSLWLQDYELDRSRWGPADNAVCKLGTNAIPYLLTLYAGREASWRRWILLVVRSRSLKQAHDVQVELRQKEAKFAFHALAAHGIDVAPTLISHYQNTAKNDIRGRLTIISVLGDLGPSVSVANRFLLNQTESTNDSLRMEAFWAVGQIHTNAEECVPRLIVGLRDKNARIRGIAATDLENFGLEAARAIPELVKMREDEERRAKAWPFALEDRLAEGNAEAALKTISNAIWLPSVH